jgi:hypothetical protein
MRIEGDRPMADVQQAVRRELARQLDLTAGSR